MRMPDSPEEAREQMEANEEKLQAGPHEHVIHAIDDESQLLISKGYVPQRTVSPFGTATQWHKPKTTEVPWSTVVVLLGLLVFLLCVIWGRPW